MAEQTSNDNHGAPQSAIPIYIYALLDQDENVRYVGKTIKMRLRLYNHIYYAKRGNPRRSGRWIRAELKMGRTISIRLLEVATEINWEARERFWIKHYKAAGAKLTNLAPGGEGTHGTKLNLSPAFRAKLSADARARFKGVPKTPAHRQADSLAVFRHAVCQLDHNGAIVDSFLSVKDAARAMGVFHGAINAALQWPNRTAKGFKWAYRDGLPHQLAIWGNLENYKPKPNRAKHGKVQRKGKLTEADVRAIRIEYRRGKGLELARRFGVGINAISQIVNRLTWRHVA